MDPQLLHQFMREGKMGMSLRHPNVVEILAVNRDVRSKQYYIVMEFVEGGNLRDFLAVRKKLEVKEALRVLEECSSALAYAHMRNLSHRRGVERQGAQRQGHQQRKFGLHSDTL